MGGRWEGEREEGREAPNVSFALCYPITSVKFPQVCECVCVCIHKV